jgi:hypothetical protein
VLVNLFTRLHDRNPLSGWKFDDNVITVCSTQSASRIQSNRLLFIKNNPN